MSSSTPACVLPFCSACVVGTEGAIWANEGIGKLTKRRMKTCRNRIIPVDWLEDGNPKHGALDQSVNLKHAKDFAHKPIHCAAF